MKFLIDAHLPRRLVAWLREQGFEAIHTRDLPMGNCTKDSHINDLSIQQGYIVVSKDADFVNSFFISGRPQKLLLVSTGNVSNADLETIVRANIKVIAKGFERYSFIEIDRTSIIFHI